jgi:6-phosphofructokinase 1
LTAGAGVILIPEIPFQMHEVCNKLREYERGGKATTIIVAAEGIGNTATVVEYISTHMKYEVRMSKLGYIQRGGSPTARSRLLADLFGARAVELLLNGAKSQIVGISGKTVDATDLEYVCNTKKPLDTRRYHLAEALAV